MAEDAGLAYRAFLCENRVMYDLNDLTVNLPASVLLIEAKAINDKGWIVGVALVDPNNSSIQHAFLLKPDISMKPWLYLLLLEDVHPGPP